MDKRPLLAVAAIVVVGASGYGIVQAQGSNGSSSKSAVATNTSTTPAPEPLNPATYDSAVRHITQLENAAFQNPDATAVAAFMTSNCSCTTDTQNRLTTLKFKGWHIDGDNVVIKSSTFTRATGPSSMEGVVTITAAGKPTVDKTGKAVDPSPSGDFQPLVYTLEKGADGQWRLADRRPTEEIVK